MHNRQPALQNNMTVFSRRPKTNCMRTFSTSFAMSSRLSGQSCCSMSLKLADALSLLLLVFMLCIRYEKYCCLPFAPVVSLARARLCLRQCCGKFQAVPQTSACFATLLLVDLLLLGSWPQAHSHVCLDLMLWQKRAASLASLRCVTEASKVLH